MEKILVFKKKQPCLNIQDGFGLNRDRNPDSDWNELRVTDIKSAKKTKLTPELKQILLEDLAYVYGNNSKTFREKLKEFKFI